MPNAEVPVTLGPKLIAELIDGDDLFGNEFDTLWRFTTRATGNQNFADQLKNACIEVASKRMLNPRKPFPYGQVPKYNEPVLVNG